ncbi:DUF7289 family protein [Methanohalophilus mahii]|uniref:DUF7308 domain-containing protein n=1 Tax=Methanohalophilus mahii (strain ATCC 35705 / DSM 5219 / SLP) TaxID=547558 RepID=D5E6Z6_METMS|nr:hypothetical protein [Methanohalophilus mahii]ADE36934.1 hypothetical protein Mmah_1436 [Methanohalophilus mahii DSM 5219]
MIRMKNLSVSCKAVSSVIGILLMFALTVGSISAMMVYSVPVIDELKDNSKSQKVEQAFTILDSRISKVALGESPLQTISFSLMGGEVSVDDESNSDSSNIKIVVQNITNSTPAEEFNCSLGTFEYTLDERQVAYEGGGIWSKYRSNGGSVMVSPPEFHYNGETLTLPIMTINGSSSTAGKGEVNIAVTSDNRPFVLYPNTSISTSRTNPVTSDKIYIYIESEYYDAWANYAESMVYTNAEKDDVNKTAIIELDVVPPMGTTTLTNQIKIGAVNASNPLPIDDFHLDLEAEDSNSDGLNPSKYEIEATSGTKSLIYNIAKKNNNQLQIEVTYKDTSVGPEHIEHWDGVDYFQINGTKSEAESTIDFLNSSFVMEYTPPNTNQNGADPDFSWNDSQEDTTELPDVVIEEGNTSFYLNDLTQHYLKLLTKDGSVVFNIDGGSQDPVDYENSAVTINYDERAGAITYLHVTQNELEIDITN